MTSPQEILAAAKDKDFKLAGCGLFAQVLVLIEPGIALKICDEPGEASEVEKKIYERLGPHPQILTTYGECESEAGKGLALAYLPAGPVVQHLPLEKYSEERKRSVDRIRHLGEMRPNSPIDGQLKQLKQSNTSIPKASSTAI